jgi:hypothetical protein
MDVLFDPVNVTTCTDRNQTPGQSLERRKRLWVDKGPVEDGTHFRHLADRLQAEMEKCEMQYARV